MLSEEDLGAGVGEAVYLVMKRTPFKHSCSRDLEFKLLWSPGGIESCSSDYKGQLVLRLW